MNLIFYILRSLLWFLEVIFLIGNVNMVVFYISLLSNRLSNNVPFALFPMAIVYNVDDEKSEHKNIARDRYEDGEYPYITILIPAFDESTVIERTIERFMKVDYPQDRYEILIATYESDNSTRDVVKKHMKIYSNVREAVNPKLPPTSKAQNVNNAYLYVNKKTEIIGLHDAEDIVSDNILRSIVSEIKDKNCIQIKVVVDVNKNSTLTEIASATGFARYYNFSVLGKESIGHLIFSSGTGTYIKKDVLDKLILTNGFFLDEKILVEDFELSLRLAKIGHKIVYNPISEVREKFPNKFSLAVRQRTRWALGNMQIFDQYGVANKFSLNERIGLFMDLLCFNAQVLWVVALFISLTCVIAPMFMSMPILQIGSPLWYISTANTIIGLEKIITAQIFLRKGNDVKIKYHRVILSVILNDIINTVAFIKASYRYSISQKKQFSWDKTQHM
ncbi:Glycosyltransferase AglI [uncultured archaeon]|nr:Glycosyltransferase AglI [uncultured archaeon]